VLAFTDYPTVLYVQILRDATIIFARPVVDVDEAALTA
jgi:hypothetical protein